MAFIFASSSILLYQLEKEENQLLKKQLQIQEQELQTIEEHAKFLENTLNELIDCIKSQENPLAIPKSDSEFSESPTLSVESPESPDGVPNLSDVTADESDNP